MAKNYKEIIYSETKNGRDAAAIFDVLEGYLDWCRFELKEYDPSHYSTAKTPHGIPPAHHPQFKEYLNSKRPRKPYLGKNPRYNNKPRNEQHFSN